jgi:iron complex transport system substrate-binding protein
MGQCPFPIDMRILLTFLALLLATVGCDRKHPAASTRPAGKVTVASLVPAATDLLIGMGAVDHLVAVSKWDYPRKEIEQLPRVGDYLSVDWEKIVEARPEVMIVQIRPDKMPPGLRQRAEQYQIRLVNVQIERLDDIFRELKDIGQTVGEEAKAQVLARRLHAELNSVRLQVAGKPPVRTLLVINPAGTAVVARDTFLNDLLEIAGGENAIPSGGPRYPEIDREKLVSLAPEAVLQLLPEASPQQLQEAQRTWTSLGQIPAVRDNRIAILCDWYILQPGSQLGKLAEQMARRIHASAATPSTTQDKSP